MTATLPIASALLLGALGWSFIEYVLHRFVFHAKSARGPGAAEHRKHHAAVDYFAPWWQKGLAAVGAIAVIWPTSIAIAGTGAGLAFTAGFVGMYLVYEVVHRRAHTHPPTGPYGRWLRKNHFAHHFIAPRLAHGVTSPLWDRAFGTQLPVERVRVPRRLAMPWLVDERGDLIEAFAADYTLVGKAAADTTTRIADTEAAMANEKPSA